MKANHPERSVFFLVLATWAVMPFNSPKTFIVVVISAVFPIAITLDNLFVTDSARKLYLAFSNQKYHVLSLLWWA
jgi:hypothetical protein